MNALRYRVLGSVFPAALFLAACGGGAKNPNGVDGGSGGATGGGRTGGASGTATGGSSGRGTGGSPGGTGGIFGFDGSIPSFDGGFSGTCSDLQACCNAMSNGQNKTDCLNAYAAAVAFGDSLCAIAVTSYKQGGLCP